ncbi:hypothetical protein AWB76_00908 [Caballeronia temeraria]|uniref:Caudovirales tail fiber assembly protein n=1 Tax=Caballeronia temeraria TaxID=1777137 RepID=A0A157ZLN0_9BURK|nr:hypothetical protein [Caballeronia temeraria]SAK46415.1 hypothetical protein AWB76_00908 [Caballeronia temeraria]
MSITAAFVDNGVVANMVVMPDDYDNSDPNVIALPADSTVTFGWLYDGTTFTMTQDLITNTYNGLAASANVVIKRLTAKNDPSLSVWQSYLAELENMDLSANNPPQWPTRP